jgi:hypothetical protein
VFALRLRESDRMAERLAAEAALEAAGAPGAAGTVSSGPACANAQPAMRGSRHGNLTVMSERNVLSLRSMPGLPPSDVWSGSMARTLRNRRRRFSMKLRRLSAYRDPSLRLGSRVLDGDANRKNSLSPEEAPRVLTALILAAQQTIEKSRPLIVKMNKLLRKRR